MNLAPLAVAAALLSTSAVAQVNLGNQPTDPNPPFTVTKVATFNYPWRIAFLPDGRMLVTEKPGKLWLATEAGAKAQVAGAPAVAYVGQGGLLGVFIGPTYADDGLVYLTYSEPQAVGGSGLALARARLVLDETGGPKLRNLRVLWRDGQGGNGGQFGAQVAFSPNGRYLYLTSGDRQRMTPAQDGSQPLGKILRLTLNGKPAPGNPMAGQTGAAKVGIIDPPKDTEAAKTAKVVRTYAYPGPNLTPAETWTSGHRNPYGLAFSPDGRLWEVEHGPQGGDELNLIQPGRNYGWPLVSFGDNYDGVDIPDPDTRPDLAQPPIYWNPVIAPGSLMFYHGALFPDWQGSALVGGLASQSLTRLTVSGKSAQGANRWAIGHRVRDVEEAPDGAVWLLEDASNGGLYRLAPK